MAGTAAPTTRPTQVTLWDLLGEKPVEMRRPPKATALPGLSPALPEPVRKPHPDPLAALIEAGITKGWTFRANDGLLQDKEAPTYPRSFSSPVTLTVRDRSEPVLMLSTPAAGSLPFVKRVEEITGLKAEWVPTRNDGTTLGQWQHVIDQADDLYWQRLVGLMEHTLVKYAANAASINIEHGRLLLRNARALLFAIGVPEPLDRSQDELSKATLGSRDGHCTPLSPWGVIHGVEDGWLTIHFGFKAAVFTDEGLTRLSLTLEPLPPPLGTAHRKSKAAAKPEPSTDSEASDATMREPTVAECSLIHAAIAAILPNRVPTYVKEIVAVQRMDKNVIIAGIRLFDDAIGRLQISGPKGSHGYRWHHCGVPGTAFHWEARTRTWERIPEEA